jgi:hypothetical protein
VAITFYLSAGRTHGNPRGYLQEVLGQSGFSRDRPKLKIFVKRPDCLRKTGFFPLASGSNQMNPTRQDHEANQTRKAQIKKHARPEKIQ